MAPPDFVYEFRKIDTQGQLVRAIRLIRPPIYASPGRNFVHDQITGLELDNRGSAYVIGIGASPGIITPTANALTSSKPSGSVSPDPMFGTCYDGFLLKIDTTSPTFSVSYALLSRRHPRRSAVRPRIGSDVILSVRHRRDDLGEFPVHARAHIFRPGRSSAASGFLVKLDLDVQPAQQLRFGTFIPDTSPIGVAVLPGGMTAVIGQTTRPCLRQLELASAL